MKIELSRVRDPATEMDMKERRRANRAMRNADRRRRLNPLEFAARPHAIQEQVHLFQEKQCLLVAANRFGKSTAGVWEVLWRATDTHPYRTFHRPHRTIWCGFPSYKFYNRVTSRLFKLWMPEEWLIEENKNEHRLTFRRRSGGVCDVFFLSYDSDQDAWAGGAVDFVWLDEEPPEEISKEAFARTIDTRGQILRTLTPLSGMGWIYDQLYLPAKEGKRSIEVVEGALAEWDDHAYMNVGRPLVPHLDRSDIIMFAEEYPDETERLIRVFGQFAKRAGLIYRPYDKKTHVIPAFPIPESWELYGSLDPGYHGFAALLRGVTPKGREVIVDELFSQQESTSKRLESLVEMVYRARSARPSSEPVLFFCDTEDPQVVLELNLRATANEYPVVFTQLEQGKKAVKAGILRVQQQFGLLPHREPLEGLTRPPGHKAGEPELYIFDNLHSIWRYKEKLYEGCRLTWELERFQWKVVKEEARDEPDESSADGAHMCAALRYGTMARLGPLEEAPEVEVPEDRDAWVWKRVQEQEDQLADLHDRQREEPWDPSQ